MGYDLALGVSTAALTMLGAWRGGLRFTAVNAFLIAWVALVAFPSLLQFAGVVTVAKERLFLATTIVNVAVSIAVLVRTSRWFDDVLGPLARRASLPAHRTRPEVPVSRWLWGLLALSLAMFTLHALLMPKIPLLELLFHPGLTANQITEAREAAAKLLPVPLPVQYLLLWNVRVFVPILVCTVLLSGRVGAKIIVIPLLIALSAMTLEKSLPALAILSSAFGVAIFRRTSLVSRPVIGGVIVALGVASGLTVATRLRDLETHRSAAALVTPEQRGPAKDSAPTRPGEANVAPQAQRLALSPVVFVYHRILAAPSDVAYSWFEYFPDRFGGFLWGRSWNMFARSQPGFQHPANLVAMHAYRQKDTAHYLKTASAYAAFHADAWANFGYGGVIGASLLAGAVLLLADVAVGLSDSALTAGASGAAVSILATTLPGGGLQAALIAQGLLLCLAIALLPMWRHLWRHRVDDAGAWERNLGT